MESLPPGGSRRDASVYGPGCERQRYRTRSKWRKRRTGPGRLRRPPPTTPEADHYGRVALAVADDGTGQGPRFGLSGGPAPTKGGE